MKKHMAAPFDKAEMDGYMAAMDAPALSALCALAKKQAARLYIDGHIPRSALYALFSSPEAKVRKNAARLIGALQNAVDAPALIEALQQEKTRFVRPSMLLALGALGGEDAAAALRAYTPEAPDGPEEEKHAKQEWEALRRARAQAIPAQIPAFAGFSRPMQCLLRAPEGFLGVLLEELADLSIPARKMGRNYAAVRMADMDLLYRARCFLHMYVPLAGDIAPDPAAVAGAVGERMARLLSISHKYQGPFPYRIEYAAGATRAEFINDLAAALDGGRLVNNPSAYGAELLLQTQKDGNLRALCKITTIPDTRFDYRQAVLPASMQGPMAACLARYARSFVPHAKRILDPCCGSGTLLIEWDKLSPGAGLTGIDLDKHALNAARQNALAAGVRMGLVHHDSGKFEARAPYDVVLANLPFGNRVNTRDGNAALYAAIAARLEQWLAPGGVAVLYTLAYTMLKKSLAAYPALRLTAQLRTEAGGLTPTVLVLQHRGNESAD